MTLTLVALDMLPGGLAHVQLTVTHLPTAMACVVCPEQTFMPFT